jgi:hypothetical protein
MTPSFENWGAIHQKPTRPTLQRRSVGFIIIGMTIPFVHVVSPPKKLQLQGARDRAPGYRSLLWNDKPAISGARFSYRRLMVKTGMC